LGDFTEPALLKMPGSRKRIWVYLAVVFPLSWALWIPVMTDKTNPVFLDLSGGPALAAMWVVSARDGNWRNPARFFGFALFLLLSFLFVTLNTALNSIPPASLHFNPWLLLPSAISAWILSGAFSSDTGVRPLLRGVVAPPNWRWPIITLLILPAFSRLQPVQSSAARQWVNLSGGLLAVILGIPGYVSSVGAWIFAGVVLAAFWGAQWQLYVRARASIWKKREEAERLSRELPRD
jgi:hypothetical protein